MRLRMLRRLASPMVGQRRPPVRVRAIVARATHLSPPASADQLKTGHGGPHTMRLKKLILQGFKSFADRTEFVFDSPITGIVGPNGCGKSNVVDGFKWVLGEQSAKSLRGEAMMDVIFNGSGGRKPSGMAEVVLVFENPQKIDGSRTLNLDVDEVAV